MEEIVKVKVTEALKKHLLPEFQGLGEVEIVLEGMTFGQYRDCKRNCITVIKGKQYRDLDTYDDLELVASINSCPFPKTIDNLHLLNVQDGLKLLDAVNKVNSPPKLENEPEAAE